MSLPIRIVMTSLVAVVAAACVELRATNGDDYPTPRPIGQRNQVRPASADEAPSAVIPTREAESAPRPKVVRIELPESASPAAPQELPPQMLKPLAMPTPRAIVRPRLYTGPRVERTFAAPKPVPNSALEEPPTPMPPAVAAETKPKAAESDSNTLRLKVNGASTGRSLPRVKVGQEIAPLGFNERVLKSTAMAKQPTPQKDFMPSQEDLDRWFTPLEKIGLQTQAEAGAFPRDLSGNLFSVQDKPRRKDWPERDFYWEAPEVWHQPFYFDDVPLERYGQTLAPYRQTWLSGLKFYMTFPLMPVKLWADPPFSKVATFGYYRVGSDNPAVRQKSIYPPSDGCGPFGYGIWPGPCAFWDVPPLPAWETTPGAMP